MSPDPLLATENIISTSFPITAMSAFLSSALTLFLGISDTIDGSSGNILTSIALSLCFCALQHEDDIVKIVLLRYPVHFGKKPQESFPTVLELLRR